LRILPAVFVLTLAGVSGCHRLPPSKPLSDLTPAEAHGRQIFLAECSRCHNADSEHGLNGPGLFGLFRQPYLPSGLAVNDARVLETIEGGRGMMPAFAGHLDQEQLTELMAYLHTL
jgi:mono/diheme cytochrome c family protein